MGSQARRMRSLTSAWRKAGLRDRIRAATPATPGQALEVPPKRIILNTTAVHESRTLYTLNSIAYGVCPYRVQHHEEVFKEIRDAGYRRRDVWRNDSKPIRIPFVEGGDAAYYVGCCFDRA